jgi:hypothetical protein
VAEVTRVRLAEPVGAFANEDGDVARHVAEPQTGERCAETIPRADGSLNLGSRQGSEDASSVSHR